MELVLGGEHSMKQILDAFKKVASVKISPKAKWVTKEIGIFPREEENNRYEIMEKQLSILSPEYMGLTICPSFLTETRRWIFFGKRKKAWKEDANVALTIAPLYVKRRYTTISFQVYSVYNEESKLYEGVEEYEKLIKQELEQLIVAAVAELQKN